MPVRKLGITTASFDLPFDQALPLAKELGIQGFQLGNVGGEHDARSLSTDARKQLADRIRSNGLEITALRGEVKGFTDPATVAERLEIAKAVVDMAVDMDVPVITSTLGDFDPTPGSPSRQLLVRALTQLGNYAEDRGKLWGAETLDVPVTTLMELYSELPNKAMAFNFDAANLIKFGLDPVEATLAAGRLIPHTHIKDAIRHADGSFDETPPGEGAVPFAQWFAALDKIGYDGYYTIEREAGDNRLADITGFIEIVRSL